MADTTQEIEIRMIPETIAELPMKRPGSGEDSDSDSSIGTITLTEEFLSGPIIVGSDGYAEVSKGPFEELKITVTISEDDPTFKAFDVYTQYSGICSVLIKHAPHWFSEPVRAAYYLTPTWDDMEDRKLDANEQYAKEIEYPANYIAAVMLRAHSRLMEGSDGGTMEIGMCKGSEYGFGGGYSGASSDGKFVISLGDHMVYDPSGESAGSKFALESHNPLSEVTFTFTDKHPIPFASYNLWGYFDDATVRNPVFLDYNVYEPDYLRVGQIISRTGNGPYSYGIKVVENLRGFSASITSVAGCLLKYEIGRWVLLAKVSSGIWKIVPSSEHYWEDAVDYLRRCAGVT